MELGPMLVKAGIAEAEDTAWPEQLRTPPHSQQMRKGFWSQFSWAWDLDEPCHSVSRGTVRNGFIFRPQPSDGLGARVDRHGVRELIRAPRGSNHQIDEDLVLHS